MAEKIRSTPILYGEVAERFEKQARINLIISKVIKYNLDLKKYSKWLGVKFIQPL